MDFNRLRYFLVVAETSSLRRSAELLGLSSPALSKAMKLLERELGQTLLRPEGRGVVVTATGRALAERARPLMEEVRSLKTSIRQAPAPESYVSIGSFEVFTTHCLGVLVQEVLGDRQLRVRELTPGALERALLAGAIDVGITYLPVPMRGVEHVKVASVRMQVVARGTRFDDLRPEDVPFVVPVQPIEGVPTRVRGLDGWPDDAFLRTVRFKVELMETALELCRRGLAAAYLPHPVIKLHNQTVAEPYRLRPLPNVNVAASPQPVYLVRRRSDPEDKLVRGLARALRILCHDAPSSRKPS